MVDAELAPLGVDPFLGRAGAAVDLRGVAGVGVQQHELADVVQQARDGQPVAVLVADLGGEPVGGVLGGERVQAEALGRGVPDAGALEEVEGAHAVGDRVHGLRAQQLDGADGGVDLAVRALRAVGEPQHGDDQRDVGLDGGDDVGGRDVVLGDDREQPVAGLGQRGERLERLEGQRQATAVALVLVALTGASAQGRPRASSPWRRARSGRSSSSWGPSWPQPSPAFGCFPFLGFTGHPGRGSPLLESLSATARAEL